MPRQAFQNPFSLGPDGHNLAQFKVAWFTGPGGGRVPRYVGWADSGSSTASPLWRIMRISYNDIDDSPTDVEWAAGTSDFNQIWDNRAVLAYS